MSAPLLTLAEAAVNRALRLDPEAGPILEPLAGKRIRVRVDGVVTAGFDVAVGRGAIVLARVDDDGAAADVELRGTPAALLSLARGREGLPASAAVEVRGDVGVLEALRRCLARLRPDWEEPLARVLGDRAGYPAARALGAASALLLRAAREVAEDLAEFLREESGLLARGDEVEAFAADAGRLRDAVERLDKRIERLERAGS